MPSTPRTALAVALLALVVAVTACGSDTTGSAARPGNQADRAFIAGMLPHHRAAVEMAAVARTRATSPFVRHLAADITRTQTAEVAQMRRVDAQLADAGVAPGTPSADAHAMGMDMSTGSLRTARPFDPAFLRAMVPHHEGAITMAREELARGEDPELRQLARDIIRAQRREVTEMDARLG
jgi:uncharacterized protein (DUF305 family)